MIQAIDRAAKVLSSLQGARRLGISELSAALSLPPSTVHGIVKSLQQHGLVAKEPGGNRYMLGPALLKLSNVYLDTLDVRARGMRWTHELGRRTGMAVRLGVRLLDEVVIIHHDSRPDGSEQMPETGLAIPVHASAMGKALLAYEPYEQLTSLTLRSLTGDTITDINVLRTELDKTVDQALAQEKDEAILGESSAAAPVVDQSGSVVAAVAVVMPTTEFPPSATALNDLRETARNISRELGSTQWPPVATA